MNLRFVKSIFRKKMWDLSKQKGPRISQPESIFAFGWPYGVHVGWISPCKLRCLQQRMLISHKIQNNVDSPNQISMETSSYISLLKELIIN